LCGPAGPLDDDDGHERRKNEMTATALPPAAKSTIDAVREGLADIRSRVSDIEALPDWEKLAPDWDKLAPDWDKLAEIPGDLIDRATGRRRRRPAWPWVALGVVAVIGVAAALTVFMLNRTSMEQLDEVADPDGEAPWTPATPSGKPRRQAQANTADTFPASDPVPSPMSPSLGA
jgi:hypothetical protein